MSHRDAYLAVDQGGARLASRGGGQREPGEGREMMPGMAQTGAAAETGPGCGCRRRSMDGLEARFGALLEDLAADRDRPDLVRRILLTAAYREDRKALTDLLFAVELDGIEKERAAAAAAVPRQRRGRHSAGGLSVVRAWIAVPLAAAWEVLKAHRVHAILAAGVTAVAGGG